MIGVIAGTTRPAYDLSGSRICGPNISRDAKTHQLLRMLGFEHAAAKVDCHRTVAVGSRRSALVR